jgi:hypothetical protein
MDIYEDKKIVIHAKSVFLTSLVVSKLNTFIIISRLFEQELIFICIVSSQVA